jgi:hypothetical protein
MYSQSGSDLARRVANQLQLSLPTVMRIVEELETEAIVRDTNLKAWSGGRKRSLIEFNGSDSVIVGIDLGSTRFTVRSPI